jgi:predicted permease
MFVRGRVVVGHAGLPRVHVGATELLRGHVLPGRGLHERRAADENRAGALDDDRLVAHRGHVGAACGARAHHRGDLRDALSGEPRLVVEDPAEVVAVWEDLVLERQEGPAGVHQVDARQVVLFGDLLRAEKALGQFGISSYSLMESSSVMSFDPQTLGLNEKPTNIQARSVSPGFFETMAIRLLKGRFFTDHDGEGAPKTILVNEAMAHRFFPGKDPVGRMLKVDRDSKDQYEILGVVSDTRDISPGLQARPQIYFSLLQAPARSLYFVIRGPGDTASLAPLLQRTVWSVNKDMPLTDVKTMEQVVSATVSEPKFHTWLLIAFAGVGLLLTLIGIYGVVSHSVSRRTHEIGIRAALGAEPQTILLLVLNQGAKLAFAGATVGLVGAWALMRFLSSQLYGIKPGDPLTLISTALLMLMVALGASYIPARRATRVDPITALRYE